ncbi:Capsular polysaccharide biosynthesis protein [Blastococcus fimeti]|nr:Capsular polysaccharide biosynthesis protein [Blastococcus fimeti]
MTHRPIGDVIVRFWALIAVVACLGGAAGFAAASRVTPTYTATTQLVLSGTGQNAEARVQNGEYVRARMSTYSALMTSSSVLEIVRANLDIPQAELTVADSLTSTNPIDTFLIDITVTDTSRLRALAVAREIGLVANTVISDLETRTTPGSPAAAEVVRAPFAPEQPDGVQRTYVALGTIAGALVGVGLALVWDARRRRRVASNGHLNGVPLTATRNRLAEVADVRRVQS